MKKESDLPKPSVKIIAKNVPITKYETEETRLKRLIKEKEKKKLAESLKSECPCRHIKSIGNGL